VVSSSSEGVQKMSVYVKSCSLQCSVPCLICGVLSATEECLLLIVLGYSCCVPELILIVPENQTGGLSRGLASGAMLQVPRVKKLPCYALPTRDLGQTVSSAAAECLLEGTC
jgi:hypothetical protein